MDNEKKNDNVSVELLRQNWEDYRHSERKRLTFAQLHVFVTVGISAFLVSLLGNDASVPKSDAKWLIDSLLTFLSVVSLWCLLNTLRLGACITASLHRCEEIIKAGDYWYEDQHWTRSIKERRLFVAYYAFSFYSLFSC